MRLKQSVAAYLCTKSMYVLVILYLWVSMCIVTSIAPSVLKVTLKRHINYIRIIFEQGFLITMHGTFLGSYCAGTYAV